MRQQLASLLRRVADRIAPDPRGAFERMNVKAVNKYIGQTERYIVALEAFIRQQDTCTVCEAALLRSKEPPHCEDCRPEDENVIVWEEAFLSDPVAELRRQYDRFDTSPLIQAGAWSESTDFGAK